jgi:hypothetical protein
MRTALRTRGVTAARARSYAAKAEEYLAAAKSELAEGRTIATTRLAIHAAINTADVVTGTRLGRRAAGQGHEDVPLGDLPCGPKPDVAPFSNGLAGARFPLQRVRQVSYDE